MDLRKSCNLLQNHKNLTYINWYVALCSSLVRRRKWTCCSASIWQSKKFITMCCILWWNWCFVSAKITNRRCKWPESYHAIFGKGFMKLCQSVFLPVSLSLFSVLQFLWIGWLLFWHSAWYQGSVWGKVEAIWFCRNSWQSFHQPLRDKRLSWQWRHVVVLNTRSLYCFSAPCPLQLIYFHCYLFCAP